MSKRISIDAYEVIPRPAQRKVLVPMLRPRLNLEQAHAYIDGTAIIIEDDRRQLVLPRCPEALIRLAREYGALTVSDPDQREHPKLKDIPLAV